MNELQRRALRCLDREVEVQTLLSFLHTVSTAAEEEQQELAKFICRAVLQCTARHLSVLADQLQMGAFYDPGLQVGQGLVNLGGVKAIFVVTFFIVPL